MYMLPASGAVLSFEACPYRVGIRFALLPLVAVYADSVCFRRTFFLWLPAFTLFIPLGALLFVSVNVFPQREIEDIHIFSDIRFCQAFFQKASIKAAQRGSCDTSLPVVRAFLRGEESLEHQLRINNGHADLFSGSFADHVPEFFWGQLMHFFTFAG